MKIVLYLLVMFVQSQLLIIGFTMLVGAKGQDRPSQLSAVAVELPYYFWIVLGMTILSSNGVFYWWCKRYVNENSTGRSDENSTGQP